MLKLVWWGKEGGKREEKKKKKSSFFQRSNVMGRCSFFPVFFPPLKEEKQNREMTEPPERSSLADLASSAEERLSILESIVSKERQQVKRTQSESKRAISKAIAGPLSSTSTPGLCPTALFLSHEISPSPTASHQTTLFLPHSSRTEWPSSRPRSTSSITGWDAWAAPSGRAPLRHGGRSRR